MSIIEPPVRMRHLPVDPKRGMPVPYFVAWFRDDKEVNSGYGEPDYRTIASARREHCQNYDHCWLCGGKLGSRHAYVIGPMCAITRTTSEPASHLDCAAYAVRACPFLSNPATRMMPEEKKLKAHPNLVAPAGFMLERNPGVSCIWVSGKAKPFKVDGEEGSRKGWLLELGDPSSVTWWCKGHPATRAEIIDSINGGLPVLEGMARKQGPSALRELQRFIDRVEKFLPTGPAQLMRVGRT